MGLRYNIKFYYKDKSINKERRLTAIFVFKISINSYYYFVKSYFSIQLNHSLLTKIKKNDYVFHLNMPKK